MRKLLKLMAMFSIVIMMVLPLFGCGDTQNDPVNDSESNSEETEKDDVNNDNEIEKDDVNNDNETEKENANSDDNDTAKKENITVDGKIYVLEWSDEFNGTSIDTKKWLPQYLPHNTSSFEGCVTDYTMKDGVLKLIIDKDAVDFSTGESNRTDGGFLVSSIQSYEKNGLHMKDNKTTVAPFTGYVTQYGYFELRCKMPACDGGGVAAWWFVGTEYDSKKNGQGTKQNGEIDVFETFFNATNLFQPKVHPWNDPDLEEWEEEIKLEGKPSDYTDKWHTYAMNWTPENLIFYVDGNEVARTNQSPQYDMAMFLSLYTSLDSGYWGGGAANNVYPKEWEIDYIRIYKDENGYPNGVTKPKDRYENSDIKLIEATTYHQGGDPAEVLKINDIARIAQLSTTGEHVNDIGFLNWADYNSKNGTCSVDNPKLPVEYIFTWDTTKSVDRVNIYSYFANGQGPTTIEIQVQKDGTKTWTSVGEFEIEWEMNTEAVEYGVLPIVNGDGIIALKLIVKDANMAWNHYVIQKVHIYKAGEAPGTGQALLVNKAQSATVTTNLAEATQLTNIIDGDRKTLMWRGGVPSETAEKDYYQLNWNTPVSVNRVDLMITKARNQGPVTWKIQVSKDGSTGWTDVASINDVKWTQLGDVLETQKLTFDTQNDIKGIRIVVEKANLAWGGYAINELEIY